MNSQGKNLFERALETQLQFGTRRSPNAIVLTNAVIIKRNFAGKDIECKTKTGKPFKKTGRRFTLVLTEELFNALCAEKGNCTYGIWAFAPEEDPNLKVYTIEVRLKMESDNPPVCKLYTKNNGKTDVSVLNSTNLAILDSIWECDIERVDLTLSAYDPEKTGTFTLWLRDLKMSQTAIEDNDNYWAEFDINEDSLPFPPNGDPNKEED